MLRMIPQAFSLVAGIREIGQLYLRAFAGLEDSRGAVEVVTQNQGF